ncbi:hypothetical protein PYR73_06235 [Acinetobacter soli]|nr:hypothetical protein PX669_06600 [Acinetobacter soli]WEI10544.1 hypothetical protein PYR73_06235 [Acinetobacter soli]
MIDLIAFLLILLGMFLLYVVSTKQIEKTKKSRFHLLPDRHPSPDVSLGYVFLLHADHLLIFTATVLEL